MATTSTMSMSASTGPFKQNDVNALPPLDTFRYENIFNVYLDNNNRYFYNLLAKVNFPQDITNYYYDVYTVPNNNLPYTYISYLLYGTIELWWLICAFNNIENPVYFPQANTQLKYLKPQYVRLIISQTSNT